MVFYSQCKVSLSGYFANPNLTPTPLTEEVSKFSQASSEIRQVDFVLGPEPVRGGFHCRVLLDLRSMAQFNTHIVIGLPDNEEIPTLSYSEFSWMSKTGSRSWPVIQSKLAENISREGLQPP